MRNALCMVCIVIAVLLSGCTFADNMNSYNTDVNITPKNQGEKVADKAPALFTANDIIEYESSETLVDYYSPDSQNYIREEIPEFIEGMEDEDGYIGDNVISYNDEVIWSAPVYAPGEPKAVNDVSCGNVQWLDDASAMIRGSILYNIETGDKIYFNEKADSMLNYALNKTRDKLAVSYLEDGTLYRLAIYDFKTKQWEDLLKRETDRRTYYFSATLVWRNDDEIVFTTGVKQAGVEVEPDSELDVWRVDTNTGESELLIKEAILCCETGSFADDKLVYAQYEQSDDGEYRPTIRVYAFNEKALTYEFNEKKISNYFWLTDDSGVIGFYDEETGLIKMYSDETYTLLGSIDISSVYKPDDVLTIEAEHDFIKFRVYSRQTESSRYYKVNISGI